MEASNQLGIKSRGEARRLIRQGAVSLIHDVSGEVIKIDNEHQVIDIEPGASFIIKVGKRRYLRIMSEDGNS